MAARWPLKVTDYFKEVEDPELDFATIMARFDTVLMGSSIIPTPSPSEGRRELTSLIACRLKAVLQRKQEPMFGSCSLWFVRQAWRVASHE
jgi:hypothetical protein